MYNDNYNNNYRPLVPFMPANPRPGYGYVPYHALCYLYFNINLLT